MKAVIVKIKKNVDKNISYLLLVKYKQQNVIEYEKDYTKINKIM